MNLGNNSNTGGAATFDLFGNEVFLGNVAPVSGNNIRVRVINSDPSRLSTIALFQTSALSTGAEGPGLAFGDTNAQGVAINNRLALLKGGDFEYTMATRSTHNGGTTIVQGSITAAISGTLTSGPLGTGDVTVTNFADSIKLRIGAGVRDAINNSATLSLMGLAGREGSARVRAFWSSRHLRRNHR
jgi:hypothetical protein